MAKNVKQRKTKASFARKCEKECFTSVEWTEL